MKAKILLRTASIMVMLHTLGHTLGALSWKNAPNAAIKVVIDGMLGNRFDFGGKSVSIGDFYAGYGYSMIGVLLMITVLLWLLSNETISTLSRQIRWITSILLLFLGVVELTCFFPLPAVLSLLAAIATLVSLFAKQGNKASS
ncbi:hypothetical protein BEL04_01865 [Mucilaginibacter sp. PPCGB 2223]|uniref:LIC_13387 family protein n=1 Tax=Mucilaginibacter sp. PPCGB 2223 TaxID=1886027 RepID=UPI000825B5E2|nr:hypothetical protein [Mucilaginibacter sp. PPCGB 2223]OCX53087.1 hypothetical protein BEL04_01865 [Mucilaginibacter sp. PPCGB 2223]